MQHPEWPPLPGNEFNLPVIWKGGVQYIDDRKLDYSVVQQLFSAQNLSALQAGQDITLTDSAPTSATAMMADGTTAGAQALTYGANDLWLELVSLDSYNQAWLTLHGTVEGDSYQLLYVNALGGPASSWTQGQIVSGAAGTNQTDFQSVYCGAETNLFFRAHHANITALVYAGQNGIEPGLTVSDPRGTFTIYASGNTSDVVVHYSLIGEAQAGIDYTNVSGMVTIPPNGAAEISIWPVPDGVVEGYESLTLKIDPDPAYLINPNYSSATITIGDSSTLAGISPYMNAVEPDGPPGVAVQQGGFWLWRGDERNSYPALDVHYVISGMASNGVDYATLNGTFTFGAGETTAYLYFTPLADYLKEGIEDVTLTLIATNDCMVAPDNSRTATVDIYDSSTTVEITPGNNAIEPNQNSSTPGQPGMFALNRYDWRSLYPALTIQYIVSGTASSGVDYTNISGTITFAENETYTNIFIEALEDNRLEGDESVTVTLQVPNGRFFSETNTATILIRDNLATNMFTKVVTNLAAPIGIDYHAPSNALIVSYNFGANGTPFTFASVTTNVVLSNNVMMTNLVV
ncbi:MAG TPA: Calx-beta domain-containing protein, partial [Candidatus Paceibacterota bacterium]|nr:Calx-beta domain-containing protein [Candidatus Paceibacterota bacterium]